MEIIKMGHFLEVALKVLSEAKKPLSAKVITDIGLSKGLLITKGSTPYQTMKSKLSTHILNKKENSIFIRTSKGEFALRSWKYLYEFKAERFSKSLLKENILVFPLKSLSKYIPKPGLHTDLSINWDELFNECRPMSRIIAERKYNYLQLISVFIIHYDKQYLTYKRTKRLPENRLHDWYSIFFGGHLNPIDFMPLFNTIFDINDPKSILFTFHRELKEEIIFPVNSKQEFIFKGLLYDDSRQVSKQHLGIVFDVFLKSAKYEIGERGFLMDSKFESIYEIETRKDKFENWSVMIINYELELLNNYIYA
jgi:predicted NUDIX family phosphoesterase